MPNAERIKGRNGSQRRAKTEDNQEKLLQSAAALMARRGFEQTSIREVTRRSGISLAGMYYYFKGKEELLYQIQERTFRGLLREQEELAASPGSPEERLRGLVQNHLSHLGSHPDELKVCTFELESLGGDYSRRIEALRRRYFKLMALLIGELMERPRERIPGDAEVRRHTLFVFGMLNWVFMWFDPRRDGSTAEIGEKIVDFTLHGLPGAETRDSRKG